MGQHNYLEYSKVMAKIYNYAPQGILPYFMYFKDGFGFTGNNLGILYLLLEKYTPVATQNEHNLPAIPTKSDQATRIIQQVLAGFLLNDDKINGQRMWVLSCVASNSLEYPGRFLSPSEVMAMLNLNPQPKDTVPIAEWHNLFISTLSPQNKAKLDEVLAKNQVLIKHHDEHPDFVIYSINSSLGRFAMQANGEIITHENLLTQEQEESHRPLVWQVLKPNDQQGHFGHSKHALDSKIVFEIVNRLTNTTASTVSFSNASIVKAIDEAQIIPVSGERIKDGRLPSDEQALPKVEPIPHTKHLLGIQTQYNHYDVFGILSRKRLAAKRSIKNDPSFTNHLINNVGVAIACLHQVNAEKVMKPYKTGNHATLPLKAVKTLVSSAKNTRLQSVVVQDVILYGLNDGAINQTKRTDLLHSTLYCGLLQGVFAFENVITNGLDVYSLANFITQDKTIYATACRTSTENMLTNYPNGKGFINISNKAFPILESEYQQYFEGLDYCNTQVQVSKNAGSIDVSKNVYFSMLSPDVDVMQKMPFYYNNGERNHQLELTTKDKSLIKAAYCILGLDERGMSLLQGGIVMHPDKNAGEILIQWLQHHYEKLYIANIAAFTGFRNEPMCAILFKNPFNEEYFAKPQDIRNDIIARQNNIKSYEIKDEQTLEEWVYSLMLADRLDVLTEKSKQLDDLVEAVNVDEAIIQSTSKMPFRPRLVPFGEQSEPEMQSTGSATPNDNGADNTEAQQEPNNNGETAQDFSGYSNFDEEDGSLQDDSAVSGEDDNDGFFGNIDEYGPPDDIVQEQQSDSNAQTLPEDTEHSDDGKAKETAAPKGESFATPDF